MGPITTNLTYSTRHLIIDPFPDIMNFENNKVILIIFFTKRIPGLKKSGKNCK
jgi:hypothetical protein